LISNGSGSIFNPGFLGANFNWWVGQIPDDSYWRGNINPETFKTKEEIPGWGYRYKVRIIGLHDREEETIPSDQLPWAQVMYPVTAGGGQGGSMQTPNIRQGMFVFGFFLDGADQQVPVIMGVLGNNSQTKLASTIGINSSNYAGTSGVANRSGSDGKGTGKSVPEVPDHNLTRNQPPPQTKPTEEAAGKNPAPVASQRQDEKLKEKITLASPCKKQNTNLKNIQIAIEEFTKKLQQLNNALNSYAAAAALKVADVAKHIEKLIGEAADVISKCLKGIYDQVKGFIQDQINKLAKPFENISIPSFRVQILNSKINAFESIICLFSKIGDDLLGLVKDFLSKQFNSQISDITNRSEQSLLTSQSYPFNQEVLGVSGTSNSNLPLTQRNQNTIATNQNPSTLGSASGTSNSFGDNLGGNTYVPTPSCVTESLVAETISQNLNLITSTVDSAIAPIFTQISNYLLTYGGDPNSSVFSPSLVNNNAITSTKNAASETLLNKNVTSLRNEIGTQGYVNDLGRASQSLGTSGQTNIVGIVNSIGNSIGIPIGSISYPQAINQFNNGDVVGGFETLVQGSPLDSGIINGAKSILNNGDIVGGLSSMATALGVNPSLVGSLANTIQSVQQNQLPPFFSNVVDFQNLVPGINFDITQAISFISSITTFFGCEPDIVCPATDHYSLYNGGSTTSQPPLPTNVANQIRQRSS
jgi:hypothetical protein